MRVQNGGASLDIPAVSFVSTKPSLPILPRPQYCMTLGPPRHEPVTSGPSGYRCMPEQGSLTGVKGRVGLLQGEEHDQVDNPAGARWGPL